MKKTRHILLFIFIAFTTSCKHTSQVTTVSPGSITKDSTILSGQEVKNIIKIDREKLDSVMNEIIGSNAIVMAKAQPEGVLGNFIADLCLTWSTRSDFQPADICILNHEGLKTSLPTGNITVGNIYDLIPNNHTLVLLKLNGKQLREVINYVINTGGQPFGGMTIYKNQAYLNNLSISDSQQYWIITTDYLANGGNNMGFLQHAIERINTNVLLRDVIIKHYQMLTLFRSTGHAKIDNRIQL